MNKKIMHMFEVFIMVYCHFAEAKYSLVNICTVIPDIVLDIRYATTNNFTKKAVYPALAAHNCYVQKITADKLVKVQQELKLQGYKLKIFDGYRPLSVQKIFWSLQPDERYVANPARGSMHNRGAAVDVTLVDLQGNDVEMPTEFDNSTIKAHHTYMDLPKPVLMYRNILKNAMVKHGFKKISTEWWHYNDSDVTEQTHTILDISFEELVQENST